MVDSARVATRWLFPVYTNELNWMFCWSYLMVEPATYEPSTLTWREKKRKFKESKLKDAHTTPLTPRKYYVFYVTMTAITMLRLLLNFAALWLFTSALGDIYPRSDDHTPMTDLPYDYTMYTFHRLHEMKKVWWAGMLFAASTVLHVIAYIIHRFHLVKLTTKNDTDEFNSMAFWFAHVGLLNWLLDIPGISVPTVRLPHVIVIILNATAALLFFCTVYFEKPIITAWGCYAPGTALVDLKYGVCPAFINDPFQPDTPVCDQPGVRCGEGAIRWKNILNETITRTFFISFISITIYFLGVASKVDYYNLSNRLVIETYNNKDG